MHLPAIVWDLCQENPSPSHHYSRLLHSITLPTIILCTSITLFPTFTSILIFNTYIVESDTNITPPTNHLFCVVGKRYLTPLISDCYVLCTLLSQNIHKYFLFFRKSGCTSCFWRIKRSKVSFNSLHQLSDLLPLVSNHYITLQKHITILLVIT